nr:Unknown Function [uncultured bacterium]
MAFCFDTMRYYNKQRQKEWDPQSQITQEFRAIEMGGEAGGLVEELLIIVQSMLRTMALAANTGRALNVSKKLARERMGLVGSRVPKENLADELADLVLTADLLAEDAGIDLGAAVRKKFNEVSDKRGLKTRIPENELLSDTWPDQPARLQARNLLHPSQARQAPARPAPKQPRSRWQAALKFMGRVLTANRPT